MSTHDHARLDSDSTQHKHDGNSPNYSQIAFETSRDGIVLRTLDGEILDGVLSAAGYEIVCAVGGREALRLADDQVFDLVLLDINMPDIDGWEVLAESQRAHVDLPIIMLSGYAENADAIERGAQRLIQKPFDSSALLIAVGEDIRTH